jgi:hypothetical protein
LRLGLSIFSGSTETSIEGWNGAIVVGPAGEDAGLSSASFRYGYFASVT